MLSSSSTLRRISRCLFWYRRGITNQNVTLEDIILLTVFTEIIYFFKISWINHRCKCHHVTCVSYCETLVRVCLLHRPELLSWSLHQWRSRISVCETAYWNNVPVQLVLHHIDISGCSPAMNLPKSSSQYFTTVPCFDCCCQPASTNTAYCCFRAIACIHRAVMKYSRFRYVLCHSH